MRNRKIKKINIVGNNRSVVSIIILIFFVLVIDGAWLVFKHPYSIDEMTSIGVPVYFAGVDWTDLMTLRLKWHGFGATILATPFIKIFGIKNAYLILQIECLLFRIILCLLTFFISKVYFKLSEVQAVVIAVVCNFGTLSPDEGRVLSAMTEVPISLIMVMVILLIIEGGLRQGKRRVVTTFLSIILVVYMALIHSRVLVAILAYIAIVVFTRIYSKKWVISPRCLIVSLLLAIVGAIALYGYIDDNLYSFAGEITNKYNTVNNIATNGVAHVFSLLEGENLYNFLLVVFSLCGSVTFYSFGFVWIIVAINVSYVYRKIIENECEFNPILLVSLFGLISYWGMNLAYSIKSTNMVTVEYFRILTYLRYSMPFAWIMVMSALAIIFKKEYNIKFVCYGAFFSSIFFSKYFLAKAVPLLQKSGLRMSDTLFNKFLYDNEGTKNYFFKMFVLSILVLLIMLIFMKKRKIYLMISIYIGVSLICMFSTFKLWMAQDQRNRNRVDVSNEVVRLLHQKNVDIDIYYYYNKNAYYQYFLVDNIDIKMNYAYDIEKINLLEGVLFSDTNEIPIEDCYVVMLDAEEYVYTLNTDIYEEISSFVLSNKF